MSHIAQVDWRIARGRRSPRGDQVRTRFQFPLGAYSNNSLRSPKFPIVPCDDDRDMPDIRNGTCDESRVRTAAPGALVTQRRTKARNFALYGTLFSTASLENVVESALARRPRDFIATVRSWHRGTCDDVGANLIRQARSWMFQKYEASIAAVDCPGHGSEFSQYRSIARRGDKSPCKLAKSPPWHGA